MHKSTHSGQLCHWVAPANDFSGRPRLSMSASRSMRSTISRVRLQSNSLTLALDKNWPLGALGLLDFFGCAEVLITHRNKTPKRSRKHLQLGLKGFKWQQGNNHGHKHPAETLGPWPSTSHAAAHQGLVGATATGDQRHIPRIHGCINIIIQYI